MQPDKSVRQGLLELGLGLREVKERLARLGIAPEALAGSLLPAQLQALIADSPAAATDGAAGAVQEPAAPGRSHEELRIERARLLLHRYALRVQPAATLALLVPTSGPPPSELQRLLGLHPPPQEAAEQLHRIERTLHGLAIPPSAVEQELVERLGLDATDLDLLGLLFAAESSPQILGLLDALYGARTEGAVPLLFLRHVFGDAPFVQRSLAADAPLVRYGLLSPTGNGHYRLAPRVLDRLRGLPARPAHELSGLAQLVPRAARLPPLPTAVLAALESLLARGGQRLLLTGPAGTGVRSVAHHLAARLDRQVLEVDVRALLSAEPEALAALALEARLQRGLLLLTHAAVLTAESTAVAPRARLLALLVREDLPLVTDGGVSESVGLFYTFGLLLPHQHLALTLPLPQERARLWQAVLSDGAPAGASAETARLAAVLSAFPLGVDHLDEAVRLARLAAPARAEPDEASLRRACELLVSHRLGEFALKVEARGRWEDLILPDETKEALQDFLLHARMAHHVLDELGYGKRLTSGRGLVALLSGPSGTGKTMAAGLLARELNVELYRVDLASVVSKYIGETEQRLAALFAEAAATGAALLFDEADSLFAKRTEVKSSNDRYANLEVNFLLQKLEEHKGISLLTTNFAHSIDKAFLRRVRFQIEFPEPDAEIRERLWRSMIPSGAPIAPEVSFRRLAERFELTGGAIRNAVLRAASRAAAARRPVVQSDLETSARAELAAQGRLM